MEASRVRRRSSRKQLQVRTSSWRVWVTVAQPTHTTTLCTHPTASGQALTQTPQSSTQTLLRPLWSGLPTTDTLIWLLDGCEAAHCSSLLTCSVSHSCSGTTQRGSGSATEPPFTHSRLTMGIKGPPVLGQSLDKREAGRPPSTLLTASHTCKTQICSVDHDGGISAVMRPHRTPQPGTRVSHSYYKVWSAAGMGISTNAPAGAHGRSEHLYRTWLQHRNCRMHGATATHAALHATSVSAREWPPIYNLHDAPVGFGVFRHLTWQRGRGQGEVRSGGGGQERGDAEVLIQFKKKTDEERICVLTLKGNIGHVPAALTARSRCSEVTRNRTRQKREKSWIKGARWSEPQQRAGFRCARSGLHHLHHHHHPPVRHAGCRNACTRPLKCVCARKREEEEEIDGGGGLGAHAPACEWARTLPNIQSLSLADEFTWARLLKRLANNAGVQCAALGYRVWRARAALHSRATLFE